MFSLSLALRPYFLPSLAAASTSSLGHICSLCPVASACCPLTTHTWVSGGAAFQPGESHLSSRPSASGAFGRLAAPHTALPLPLQPPLPLKTFCTPARSHPYALGPAGGTTLPSAAKPSLGPRSQPLLVTQEHHSSKELFPFPRCSHLLCLRDHHHHSISPSSNMHACAHTHTHTHTLLWAMPPLAIAGFFCLAAKLKRRINSCCPHVALQKHRASDVFPHL